MLRNNSSLNTTNKGIYSRTKILKNIVFILLAIILVRLFFIQIVEHNHWVAKADEQHTLLETIVAKRGEIYMMEGEEPVAVVLNQTTYQIIIDPSVTKKDEIEPALENYAKDYIVVDFDEIYQTEGLRYSIVAKNVPREIAAKISELGISAVWFQKNNQRVYPEGEMASELLGFVNADGVGQYGVEGSLNTLLSGKDGLLKTTSDINNVALSIGNDNIKIPAEDGKNLVLSVDRGFERGVEELTDAALDSSLATNASVLVMNPNNGEVLAMANLPNYDPADYGNVTDASAYINYTTEVPYEPASICKSFAFSAAINEGVMSPTTTYFNEGYEIIDSETINNAVKYSFLYGNIDMQTALYWSLNTGSIYALKLLGGNTAEINQQGREKLYDYYYNKFRLGRETGIELIESEGFVWDPNADVYGLNAAYANMTFGQNLNLTMVQVASAFSAVVNGGVYYTPTILKGTLENEKIVPQNTELDEDKILSDETSSAMRGMLINNRSNKADRAGYDIGGKTGTAQTIIDGAYTMDEFIGSYIGFVGTEGELPKLVIMVKMWGEGQHIEGNKDPMSLFDSISNYAIDYFKIKPGA